MNVRDLKAQLDLLNDDSEVIMVIGDSAAELDEVFSALERVVSGTYDDQPQVWLLDKDVSSGTANYLR